MNIIERLDKLQELAGLCNGSNLDTFMLDKFPNCNLLNKEWTFFDNGIYRHNLIKANIFWKEIYRQWNEYILFADDSLFDGQEGNTERIHELIAELRKEVEK